MSASNNRSQAQRRHHGMREPSGTAWPAPTNLSDSAADRLREVAKLRASEDAIDGSAALPTRLCRGTLGAGQLMPLAKMIAWDLAHACDVPKQDDAQDRHRG